MRTNRLSPLKTIQLFIAAILLHPALCPADTLTNRTSGETLHGYTTSQTESGKTIVVTEEKGSLSLSLSAWDITPNSSGRKNTVAVIAIDEPIMYEIETAAFESTLCRLADEGPLFILIEIDTPGGRVDLAQRICAAITKTTNCTTIAFIKGGQYSGAISAGAAVALACDKICMAPGTVIGAATLITPVFKDPTQDKVLLTEVVEEKMNSAWRSYLASLAEQNKRPGILAMAMVDNQMEVVEVTQSDKTFFIDPVNLKPGWQTVRTWSRKGSLLTLTPDQAIKSGIADQLADNRQQLFETMNLKAPEVIEDTAIQDARRELRIAERQVEKMRQSFDFRNKQAEFDQPLPKILKMLRETEAEFEKLIRLAKKYPDLNLDPASLEEELNSAKALQQELQAEGRARSRSRRR